MAADGHRRRLLLMERLAATRSHALRLALALLVWSGAFVASKWASDRNFDTFQTVVLLKPARCLTGDNRI